MMSYYVLFIKGYADSGPFIVFLILNPFEYQGIYMNSIQGGISRHCLSPDPGIGLA
jgi:hypothetical protein